MGLPIVLLARFAFNLCSELRHRRILPAAWSPSSPAHALLGTAIRSPGVDRDGGDRLDPKGIAVTSHASQSKTVDQVIVNMPIRSFTQANEAQFYVSRSRARWVMHVFTDSKVALRDAVTRPSKRLSCWELLNLAEKDRTLRAELDSQRAKVQMEQQEKAYER
jgi:hypothetical protein